jgi:2-keto-4-pentenoate hydratase/2-oxohepta-3-ene-1,7-dioic acid hydratase in catechol pathway
VRLCTFLRESELGPGVVVGDAVVDLRMALDGQDDELTTTRHVVALEPSRRGQVAEAAEQLASAGDVAGELSDLRLGPPIPDPEKIICLGLNYRDHAKEAGLDVPRAPILFGKYRNSLIGSRETIVPPPGAIDVDYEGELAIVVGKVARGVAAENALDHVAGAMPLNDVSARVLQTQTTQWMAGKAIDTFAPCGPTLVTLDEIGDLQALGIETRVNGEVVQDGNTAEMIFPVAETIAFLSTLMTLMPGDIIATGTPAGVGFSRVPPVLLGEGDVVEIEVEGLEPLSNPVGAPAEIPRIASIAAQ